MRLLVLGSTGMLGQAMMRESKSRGIEVVGIARKDAEICLDVRNDQLLQSAWDQVDPFVTINTVAVTNLNDCEKNVENAYLINARPVAFLAELCRKNGRYLIQISTDHYYTGDRSTKHKETDAVRLVNEYARTKFIAEQFALTYENTLVVRTNIVGFRGIPSQPTFIESMISNLQTEKDITLFNDYYTSSIAASQLSAILLDLIPKRPTGIFNIAGREVSSKEQFVKCLAKTFGYSVQHAQSGSVKENKDVLRAESLGLDVTKAEKIIGYKLPSVNEVIECLSNEKSGVHERT